MARVVTVFLIVAVICVWAAPSPGERKGRQSYTANGGIAIALLDNKGSFGNDSFNIGHGGASYGAGQGGNGGNHNPNVYGGGGSGGDTGHTIDL